MEGQRDNRGNFKQSKEKRAERLKTFERIQYVRMKNDIANALPERDLENPVTQALILFSTGGITMGSLGRRTNANSSRYRKLFLRKMEEESYKEVLNENRDYGLFGGMYTGSRNDSITSRKIEALSELIDTEVLSSPVFPAKRIKAKVKKEPKIDKRRSIKIYPYTAKRILYNYDKGLSLEDLTYMFDKDEKLIEEFIAKERPAGPQPIMRKPRAKGSKKTSLDFKSRNII